MVPLESEDVPCTGIFEGTGKYEFSAGGIYVDFNGVQVKVGTGFSDRDRKKMWEDQDHYIGLISEIEFKEKTKNGSMRQPRFKGWRLDKAGPNPDYISKSDLDLFERIDSIDDVVERIERFYSRYHSLRYVGDFLVIRLHSGISQNKVEELQSRFSEILKSQGEIYLSGPLPEEEDELGR